MATSSYTSTYTYTVADIKRVLGSFAADFGMMVASAGLVENWPRSRQDLLVADLVDYANSKYLAEIDVSMWRDGAELRAARYHVSDSAQGWINERPGSCMWPRTPDATIEVVAVGTSVWKTAPSAERDEFRAGLRLQWGPSDLDISHSGLVQRQDRRFAANGFGLQRAMFGG
jgi:Bacterial HORMA domain family 1